MGAQISKSRSKHSKLKQSRICNIPCDSSFRSSGEKRLPGIWKRNRLVSLVPIMILYQQTIGNAIETSTIHMSPLSLLLFTPLPITRFVMHRNHKKMSFHAEKLGISAQNVRKHLAEQHHINSNGKSASMR